MKMLLVKQIDVVEIYADEAMALCRSRPRPESAWEFPGIPGKGKIGRNGSFLAHMRIPSRIPAHIALQTHMPVSGFIHWRGRVLSYRHSTRQRWRKCIRPLW